jgi:hypothetical protein
MFNHTTMQINNSCLKAQAELPQDSGFQGKKAEMGTKKGDVY